MKQQKIFHVKQFLILQKKTKKQQTKQKQTTYSPTVHFCSVIGGKKKQHLIVKLTQHCGAYVHPDPVMSLL